MNGEQTFRATLILGSLILFPIAFYHRVQEHTLVAAGSYRWVRHPFYPSVGLWILASSLVAANGFLLVTGGLAFVLMVVRTREEEENLLARFGDAYRAYMERTGRFLPKMGVQ